MIPKDGITVQYIIEASRRRFWYVVIPAFLIFTASVVYCIKAPRIYRSNSLILIMPQEVPTDYVKPTVTTNVMARLSAITEQIMSRSRLEEIITKHDLYPGSRKEGNIQRAVENLRNQIKINFKESKRDADPITSFEISFQGEKPAIVRDVTKDLAELYIHYNFKLRQEQAAGTSKFLERELAKMSEELRQWEDKVRAFKEENMGLIPEQMQNNYQILNQLQQQLESLNTVLQKTEDRRVLLQGQLRKLEAIETDYSGSGGDRQSGSTQDMSLGELRARLQQLKSRYSDKHPDVIKLENTIAKIEEAQKTADDDGLASSSGEQAYASETQRLLITRKEDALMELRIIDKDINSLKMEIKKTNAEIDKYRSRIEIGPKVEQMFVDLRRGYEQANQNYQSLLEKKLQAEMAENLEITQKGEQFKILDQATLPNKPYKPDIPRLLSMGLLLALGCGFGLAFLCEYMDPSFYSRKELESVTEIPVLVSIPTIETDGDRRWKKFKTASAVCILVFMCSAIIVAMYLLWQKSPGFLPIPL